MIMTHREMFGRLLDGRESESITLTNGPWQAELLTQGAILRSWIWPDRDGDSVDVVCGCESAEDYAIDTSYHGAVAGRFANRIARGHLVIDGVSYQLPINSPPNHLHGGSPGFDKAIWTAEIPPDHAAVIFRHHSPSGDQGYPGDLDVKVTINLADDGSLRYDYLATCSAPTVVNLTAHMYFNLAGHDAGAYEDDHRLCLFASAYVPKDATGIPLGNIAAVAGTPWDFTTPRTMAEPMDHAGLAALNGYDHTWVVDGPPGQLRPAARVSHSSGRILEVSTTEPGIHYYNGHYNDASPALMKSTGRRAASRSGFALETQHFPDSPNHPSFPSTLLLPGMQFVSSSVYRPVCR